MQLYTPGAAPASPAASVALGEPSTPDASEIQPINQSETDAAATAPVEPASPPAVPILRERPASSRDAAALAAIEPELGQAQPLPGVTANTTSGAVDVAANPPAQPTRATPPAGATETTIPARTARGNKAPAPPSVAQRPPPATDDVMETDPVELRSTPLRPTGEPRRPINFSDSPPVFPTKAQAPTSLGDPSDPFGPPPPGDLTEPLPLGTGVDDAGRLTPEATIPSGTAPAGPVPSNVIVHVSELLLNKLIEQQAVNEGLVQDIILGAQVSGQQTTSTRLKIDLRPSAENAHGVFLLSGEIQSRTNAFTPNAAIASIGRHHFQAVKDVYFSGEQFSTRHAMIFVRAQNENLGALTPLTGSAFGGLAERIALRVADNRRPQAEAVARQRIANDVFPKFDGEVDRQLANANQQLRDRVIQVMDQAGLRPEQQTVRTSDTALLFAARFPGEASTSDPRMQRVTSSGQPTAAPLVSVSLYEGFLNGMVDRLNLKGKTTTDRQLRQLLERIRAVLPDGANLHPVGTLPAAMADIETTIELDAEEPLRFVVADDEVSVVLKAKFRPAGQNLLPAMRLQIPFESTLNDGRWTIAPGKLGLSMQDGSPLSPLVEGLIRQSIEANLLEATFPAQLPAANWKAGDVPPQLTELVARDGWLTIVLDQGAVPGTPAVDGTAPIPLTTPYPPSPAVIDPNLTPLPLGPMPLTPLQIAPGPEVIVPGDPGYDPPQPVLIVPQ